MARFVVGEQGRAAVGVVNDRDLKVGAFGGLGVDQVTGAGDVGDDRRGDPPADVALDEGLAEPDAEDLRRVDPAVDAGDDVQVQVRDELRAPHSGIGVRAEYAPASRSSMRVGPAGAQPRSSRVTVLVAARSMPKKVPIHPK
jgi:hypothetical protein